MDEYMTTKEAAEEISISYPSLMARLRKKKIVSTKKGWMRFIHKDEVERAKRAENNADTKSLERGPR